MRTHELSCAAGRRHAERAEGEAQVLAASAAEPAGTARKRGVDSDSIADAHIVRLNPGGDDGTGHLVARHHGQHAVLARQDVQVGAAQPDGGDLDDHVAGPGRRVVDRRDPSIAPGAVITTGSHAASVSLS